MYHTRDLVRRVDGQINAVRRELSNLQKAGLVKRDERGFKVFYQANTTSSLFPLISTLAHQTFSLGGDINKNRDKLGHIEKVYFSKSFLNHDTSLDSEADFVAVGQIILPELADIVKKEEEKRGREINYMILSGSELEMRLSRRDPAIIDFFTKEPSRIL